MSGSYYNAYYTTEPRYEKTLFMSYVKNKGADQPVHRAV